MIRGKFFEFRSGHVCGFSGRKFAECADRLYKEAGMKTMGLERIPVRRHGLCDRTLLFSTRDSLSGVEWLPVFSGALSDPAGKWFSTDVAVSAGVSVFCFGKRKVREDFQMF